MSYLDEKGVNKLWSKAKEKFATTSDVSGKANLAGNNTFTGGQTITGDNAGYSINASGYVKGSWLQAPSTGKASSNTGKVCVLDGSGWVYYRTPEEIVSDGGGVDLTNTQTITGYKMFSSIDATILKEGGTVLSSKYVNLANEQTITGTKSFTSGLKVSGRVANSGDDEGIVINTASNGYAGVCLGTNSGERSVFYFNNSHQAWWRYNNGTTSYDIHHPKKSGTIATTSDISDSISTGTLSAKTALKVPSGYVYLVFVVGTNSYAKFGNSTSQMNYSVYHFMFIQGSLGGSGPIIARFLNNSTWSMITAGSTASFYFDREVQYIKFKLG